MALRRFRYVSKASIIFYFYAFVCLLFGWIAWDYLIFNIFSNDTENGENNDFVLRKNNFRKNLRGVLVVNVSDYRSVTPTKVDCNFWTCFNVYRCGFYERKLKVYVYPLDAFVDENDTDLRLKSSKEFRQILETIKTSRFNENDSNKACIFTPPFDILHLNRRRSISTGFLFASLPYWNGGENHLIFNFLHGPTDFGRNSTYGRAIVAAGGYGWKNYRRTFDIAIPVFNYLSVNGYNFNKYVPKTSLRPRLLFVPMQSFSQISQKSAFRRQYADDERVLLLDHCSSSSSFHNKYCGTDGVAYDYPEILESAQFCLVLETSKVGQMIFSDALMTGCIPVVVSDSFLLPFFEVVDWRRAALLIYTSQMESVLDILLTDVSRARAQFMQIRGRKLWQAYFSSPGLIATTSLKILEDRIFPENARSYEEWNLIDDDVEAFQPPLFLPRKASDNGFTAIILTYDRVSTLFKSIGQLAAAKSLTKIIVVWNNQLKQPPDRSEWPFINKPIKIIKMPVNKLTNRFLPFDEIETEAVLSLDDDITMLNGDELEFAYQVWREFPSYLVGFPSRVHTVDVNSGKITYNSEWTNNISMILTGAAFYHKYYNYLFTNNLSSLLKHYVDGVMNCEDILMNFLIANVSGQPGLKVTPRKKFRASEFGGHDLSTDSGHLKQRTMCLNKFETEFGGITLKSVEFRIDPVLYKMEETPSAVLSYKDVGPL